MPLATSLDKDAIREAYEDVRSDLTDTEWAVFKFDGAQIIVHERGQCFEEFRQQFGDSERAFGYIRIQMGDEMSKRKKFIFLTWIGQEVGVIQRAKMSTDKALIKDVLNVSATFFLSFSHEAYSPVFLSLFAELRRGTAGWRGGRAGHWAVPRGVESCRRRQLRHWHPG